MINELCPMRWRIQIAAFAAVVAVNYAPAFGQDIQYREDPNAEKRMTLVLKDGDPKAQAARAHVVPRAKFYGIDVHITSMTPREFTAAMSRHLDKEDG